MSRTVPKQVYFYSKVFCVVLFTYCLIELRLNAEMARKWYHNNWCGETSTMRPRLDQLTPLQGEPSECLYWVGSVWDYVFLTSSAFHDGWTLLHVGLVSSVVLLIIVLLIEISDRGVL